jgi:hypothetical protein
LSFGGIGPPQAVAASPRIGLPPIAPASAAFNLRAGTTPFDPCSGEAVL